MAEAKVKQAVKVEGMVVTMTYPEILKTVRIDCSKFEPTIRDGLMVHGMKQIAVDCGAGKSAAEAYAQLTKRLEAFNAGDWTSERVVDTTETVIAAVLRAYKGKWTAEQLQKASTVKPEQVKTWRADAKVKVALAKMREEKAREAAKGQTTDLEIEL